MFATANDAGLWSRILSPGARHYLIALTLFVVVFALIPFGIYAHASEDWGFSFRQLLRIALLGLGLFGAFALLIRLVATVHAGAARTLACAAFCLGTFLLLAQVYAPVQINPLDGSEMSSDEPALQSAIEVGLLAVLIVVFIQLSRGRGLTIAALFSSALLLISLGYAGVLTLVDERKAQLVQAPTEGGAGIEGNVYHIVLDTMRTDAFRWSLEQAPQLNQFEGFQLFAHNVSNYITTRPSSASYFTGTLFKSGEFGRWVRQWRRNKGIFPAASAQGYHVWMYAPFANWKTKHVDRFWDNKEIFAQDSGFADAGFYDLIEVWLVSLAPNSLTNETLGISAGLRDHVFELLTGEDEPISLNWLHPHAGFAMLRRLVLEEELRAANGQYVYAHAALPHAPYVFDKDCNYVGYRDPLRRSGYLPQSQCAVILVVKFLKELQRRGRYDAATVIVHGDTGHGIGRVGMGSKDGGPTTFGSPNGSPLKAVDALLMIKRPHADGPLQIVDTPTQLVDLFPTLIDLLDLKQTGPVDGKSVYSLDADEHREAVFSFDPARKYGQDFVRVRIEDQTDLRKSPLTPLGPVIDPASQSTQLGHN